MTDLIRRADAIEAVDRWRDYDGDICWREAIDKAKDALSALPSADAEQVTGKLKNPCDSLLTGDSDECKEQKSKLESAEAVQGWIPCEEEMPIDSEEVIASVYWTEYGDSIIAYGHYSARFDKWRLYSDMEGELIKGYEVTAWMPLPKPYRAERREP